MAQSASVLLYITAADPKQAHTIGLTLVEEKLVACVNIIDKVNSIYWWEGRIHDGTESVVIAKTRASLVASVTARVKKLHSYEVPCVVSVPIGGGNADFLAWVTAQTAPEKTAVPQSSKRATKKTS